MVTAAGLHGFPVRSLNGLGVVASRRRRIRPGHEYNAYFPRPTHADPYLSRNAENGDTLERFIPGTVRKYQSDTARIALVLKRETLEATCRAIWEFVYHHVQYKPDSPHQEEIRTPARTWADRATGVDCDCYTVFISSILLNLGIRHLIRMAAYNTHRGFQHVYVVVPKSPTADTSRRSDYLAIDCVMDAFDSEKPYLYRKDREMLPAVPAGLNGPAIHLPNGLFQGLSGLVYDDVYYVPAAGTWALKGVDGGYYLEANPRRRYVEPHPEHLDGFFRKLKKVAGGVLRTGLKIAAPLAKTAINAVIPGGGVILNAASSLLSKVGKAKNAVSNAITHAVSEGKKAVMALPSTAINAVQEGGSTVAVPQLLNRALSDGQSAAARIESALNTAPLEARIKAANNNAVRSIDSTKNALQKAVQASNKAVVMSLDSVSKESKAQLDRVADALNRSLTEVNAKAATTEEATQLLQRIAEKTAAVSAGTQAINKSQSAVISSEAQKNEIFRNRITAWGKYAMIALAVLVAWFLFNKQPKLNR